MIDLLRPFKSIILMAADMINEKDKATYKKEPQTKESIEYHIRKAQEKRQRRAEKLKRIKQDNSDEFNLQK